MSNTALTKTETAEKPMEFIPFGAADKIKLNVSIVQNTICIPTKTGKVCTVRDAVRFMMLCQAQRLNPFAGDCHLCGYDGKNGAVFSMITAHQAFLKRAETCADYEGMESGVILLPDKESNLVVEREGDFKLKDEICVGGWARVHRKGRKPTYRRLSVAAMVPAYETPFWSDDKTPGQIVKCAEADALRATFPTLLGGLYSGDELRMNETISAVISADAPPGAPAFIQGDAPRQIPGAEPDSKLTPQSELEALVLGGGFNLNHVQKFGADSGNITNADSLTSFAEISTDEAKRLLKNKAGFLAALKTLKGE